MTGASSPGSPTPPAAPPTVDAVVVNYNAAPHLGACLASLRAEGVGELVVVDNGSTDGSKEVAEAAVPPPVWLPTGGNLGYGRAANRGAAGLSAPYLLIANPDLVVRPGAIDALRRRLEEDPAVGVVGPRILNTDGSTYPSARAFPDMVDAAGHALLGTINPDNRFTARYKGLAWDHELPGVVGWVSGACFLIRRELWDRLGGFDPSYFMYMEDVDLCWRASAAGARVAYEPAAVVIHVQGASANQHPYRMLTAHHRSMLRFAGRTLTGRRRAALPLVALAIGGRLVMTTLQHRLGIEAPTQAVP